MIPLAAKDISLFFDVVKFKIVTYSVRYIATDSGKTFSKNHQITAKKKKTLKCQVKVVFILSKVNEHVQVLCLH